jgi:hypothetical protein
MASSSLRQLRSTRWAVSSWTRPRAWPSRIDWEKEWMPWLRTSLSMKVARRRAARSE